MSGSKNQSLIAPYTSTWDYEISIQKKIYGLHAAQSHMHEMGSYINVINKNTSYATPAMIDQQIHRYTYGDRRKRRRGRGKDKDHGKMVILMQVCMLSWTKC